MEKNVREFSVFIMLLVVSLTKSSNEDFTCCPSSTYIFSNACYDPVKNTSSPMKLVCNSEWGNVTLKKNFTIESGKFLVRLIPALPVVTFGPEVACYGNATKDKNVPQNSSITLILCNVKYDNDVPATEDAFVYCSIVSVVFLALATILYASFKELRDLFGWSVINFCGSLALGLGIYVYIRFVKPSNMSFCAAQGFLAYFFLVAAFFWTNSISIQVLKDTRRPSVVDYGWKELKWYMLYSWGTPALLTTIMAVVNFHPGDHEKPGIGLNHCWFLDARQQWYYMFSVMSILLLINFGIFIYVATMIWRLSVASTPIQALKFKLWMTVKLIILMGLPWILQIISATTGGGRILKVIIDISIGLQGFLIFLVLVVRKRVVKVLHQRGLLDWCAGPVERWLALADDAETNVVQHTDVPLHDDHLTNGK